MSLGEILGRPIPEAIGFYREISVVGEVEGILSPGLISLGLILYSLWPPLFSYTSITFCRRRRSLSLRCDLCCVYQAVTGRRDEMGQDHQDGKGRLTIVPGGRGTNESNSIGITGQVGMPRL
ncbi:MAG: hypothetical protein JKY56_23770 [Kofleriaceae bacterium]|nr:hypothetical protein [Kofleriaceae bacterium]